MAINLASSAQSIPKFWAFVREEALKEWNGDSSRPQWDLVEERLTATAQSPVATISPREQTAASEVARIRPELKRLQKSARELNSLLRKTQRRVRATMRRMGEIVLWKAPTAVLNAEDRAMREQVKALKKTFEDLVLSGSGVLGIGPNERQLRAILDLQPFQFPKLKPVAFPKNDRVAVVLAVWELPGMRRPVNLKDLALASLLLGKKPKLDADEQWTYAQAIAVEQDNMRKAVNRAKDHGRLGADAADWLVQGVFVQASPHTPKELANLKE